MDERRAKKAANLQLVLDHKYFGSIHASVSANEVDSDLGVPGRHGTIIDAKENARNCTPRGTGLPLGRFA
jgi:hypothetical protein